MHTRWIPVVLLAIFWTTPSTADPLKIFACEPEWAALAKALGGDDVEVYSATTALQDVHKIQPRPSLIAQFRQAQLAVCTGAELELGWLPVLQQTAGNPALRPGLPGFFEAYRYVDMLEIPTSLDRAEGDVHPYGNPHIQTSPRNIARIAPALTERLAQIDPAHAEAYRQRGADFEQRWAMAIQGWEQRAAPLKGVKVISQHRSWSYLYQWLGMTELDTLEPKPGVPPSAAHLQSLLAQQQSTPARLVIYAAYQPPAPAQSFAERSGTAAVELPFTVGGAPSAGDLFGLFDTTLTRLLTALGAKP